MAENTDDRIARALRLAKIAGLPVYRATAEATEGGHPAVWYMPRQHCPRVFEAAPHSSDIGVPWSPETNIAQAMRCISGSRLLTRLVVYQGATTVHAAVTEFSKMQDGLVVPIIHRGEAEVSADLAEAAAAAICAALLAAVGEEKDDGEE